METLYKSLFHLKGNSSIVYRIVKKDDGRIYLLRSVFNYKTKKESKKESKSSFDNIDDAFEFYERLKRVRNIYLKRIELIESYLKAHEINEDLQRLDYLIKNGYNIPFIHLKDAIKWRELQEIAAAERAKKLDEQMKFYNRLRYCGD